MVEILPQLSEGLTQFHNHRPYQTKMNFPKNFKLPKVSAFWMFICSIAYIALLAIYFMNITLIGSNLIMSTLMILSAVITIGLLIFNLGILLGYYLLGKGLNSMYLKIISILGGIFNILLLLYAIFLYYSIFTKGGAFGIILILGLAGPVALSLLWLTNSLISLRLLKNTNIKHAKTLGWLGLASFPYLFFVGVLIMFLEWLGAQIIITSLILSILGTAIILFGQYNLYKMFRYLNSQDQNGQSNITFEEKIIQKITLKPKKMKDQKSPQRNWAGVGIILFLISIIFLILSGLAYQFSTANNRVSGNVGLLFLLIISFIATSFFHILNLKGYGKIGEKYNIPFLTFGWKVNSIITTLLSGLIIPSILFLFRGYGEILLILLLPIIPILFLGIYCLFETILSMKLWNFSKIKYARAVNIFGIVFIASSLLSFLVSLIGNLSIISGGIYPVFSIFVFFLLPLLYLAKKIFEIIMFHSFNKNL